MSGYLSNQTCFAKAHSVNARMSAEGVETGLAPYLSILNCDSAHIVLLRIWAMMWERVEELSRSIHNLSLDNLILHEDCKWDKDHGLDSISGHLPFAKNAFVHLIAPDRFAVRHPENLATGVFVANLQNKLDQGILECRRQNVEIIPTTHKVPATDLKCVNFAGDHLRAIHSEEEEDSVLLICNFNPPEIFRALQLVSALHWRSSSKPSEAFIRELIRE